MIASEIVNHLAKITSIALLVVTLIGAYVLPFASQAVVERINKNSGPWHLRSARSRRLLSRTPGLLVVIGLCVVFVAYGVH